MLKTRPSLIMGLTHAAALLIGWGAWTAFRPSHAADDTRPSATTKSRPRPSTRPLTAEEVLATLDTRSPTPTPPGNPTFAQFIATARQLMASMKPPENFETALAEEMKSWNGEGLPTPKTAALLFLWLFNDSESLSRWSAQENDKQRNQLMTLMRQQLVAEAMASHRIDTLEPFLSGTRCDREMLGHACRILAQSADLDGIAKIKAYAPPAIWPTYWSFFTIGWPWKERSKLVEFTIAEKHFEILSFTYGRCWQEEPDAPAWIASLMRDTSLDPTFREEIINEQIFRSLVLTGTSLPLADRLTPMRDGTSPVVPDKTLLDRLTLNDVNHWLQGPADLNFQFRTGQLDAAQVLARLQKEMPELSKKSPAAFREAVFQNLVTQDPQAAMSILAGLSPEERAQAVFKAARTTLRTGSPEIFLTALREVPADDASLREDRLRAWTSYINIDPTIDGNKPAAYLDWIHTLPEGPDREMALYALTTTLRDDDPDLSARLRGELKDLDLKQRLEKTQ